jgi:hemolysin type calcium-binding protein
VRRAPVVALAAVFLLVPAAAHAATIEVSGPLLRVEVPPSPEEGVRSAGLVSPLPDGAALVAIYGVSPSQVTVGNGCQAVGTGNAPFQPMPGTGQATLAATCNLSGVTALAAELTDAFRSQGWQSSLSLPTKVDAASAPSTVTPPGDLISTGSGGDTINAGNGPDEIDGGGAPYLGPGTNTSVPSGFAKPDRNTLDGGGGDDRFLLDGQQTGSGALGRDLVIGGAGVDTVTYAARFGVGAPGQVGVQVTLDGEANDGDPSIDPPDSTAPGEGDDVGTDVENVTGTRREDTLIGNGGRNVLEGGEGSDTLTGAAGVDTLIAREPPSAGGGLRDTLSCGAPAPPPPPPPRSLTGRQQPAPSILGIFLLTSTGRDRLEADLLDVPPADCEDVVVMAVDEPAAVEVGAAARLVAGRLRVPLRCPRAARRTCRGTLRLAGRRAGGPAARFRVRRGARRTVRVRLGAAAARALAARGRVARLVSVERGREGEVTRFAYVKVRRRAR